jgi:hypothetical protein
LKCSDCLGFAGKQEDNALHQSILHLHRFLACHHEPSGVVDKPKCHVTLFLVFFYPGLVLEDGFAVCSPPGKAIWDGCSSGYVCFWEMHSQLANRVSVVGMETLSFLLECGIGSALNSDGWNWNLKAGFLALSFALREINKLLYWTCTIPWAVLQLEVEL